MPTIVLLRLHPAGVAPLEIWDLPVGGQPLCERVGHSRVDVPALAMAIREIRRQRRFDTVFIGGGLGTAEVASALARELPAIDVILSPDARFVGEPGGKAILSLHGFGRGAVVDVGQTAIKVSRFDDGSAPLRHVYEMPAVDAADDLLSRALAESSPAGGQHAIVLALPCALDEHGVPGPCTFPGWEGDRDRIYALVARAAMPPGGDLTALLCNDAELAAVSAQQTLGPGARALVLTLGFGPGAALIGC